MSAVRHELTVEQIDHDLGEYAWIDFWGECSCGWTCGPTTEADVVDSHREHVRHRALRDADQAPRDPYTGAVLA
jgi:hypothetical protein